MYIYVCMDIKIILFKIQCVYFGMSASASSEYFQFECIHIYMCTCKSTNALLLTSVFHLRLCTYVVCVNCMSVCGRLSVCLCGCPGGCIGVTVGRNQ